MKRFLILLLTLISLSLVGCGKKTETNPTTTIENNTTTTQEKKEENMKDNLIKPFWKSDIMYDETVILVCDTDESGNILSMPKANLLFAPTEIIEVKRYFSEENPQTEYFTEGVDFEIKGNVISLIGKIKSDIEGINSMIDTKMPFITDKQLDGRDVFPGLGSTYTGIPSTTEGLNIPYTESYHIVKMQISVTYKHNGNWTDEVPVYQGNKLSNIVNKLKSKEEANILVFGDSISTGSNSSSILNINPMLEPWYELMEYGLEKAYDTNINLTNKSVGGWTSLNGIGDNPSTGWVKGEQISQVGLPKLLNTELKGYSPDLVIIGFGMNDATLNLGLNNYATNIRTMIDAILERNPNCDIILLGTMLANPTAKDQSKNQTEYSALNNRIAGLYENANIATLDIGLMHQNLLKYKKYMDMTGNNVNHPNDFMARVYCWNLLETLIEE